MKATGKGYVASLAPGEWRLWIDHSADRLRIRRATLQGLIEAIIKRKEKEKASESLVSLPSEQQETRLGELAKRLDVFGPPVDSLLLALLALLLTSNRKFLPSGCSLCVRCRQIKFSK